MRIVSDEFTPSKSWGVVARLECLLVTNAFGKSPVLSAESTVDINKASLPSASKESCHTVPEDSLSDFSTLCKPPVTSQRPLSNSAQHDKTAKCRWESYSAPC